MIDVKGKNVFLSGPMSGLPEYNVAEFAKAHAMLKERGVSYTFNPAIRYLVLGAEKAKRMTHDDYMADCIHELTMREKRSQEWCWVVPMKYDMLVLLEGWEESEGSRSEKAVAESCGIPVYELWEVIS